MPLRSIVDGDGRDEIVIEYGVGRGTSAYERRLTIRKAGVNHGDWIFETSLSGYVPGQAVLFDPWYRRYRFVDREDSGAIDVEVCSIPPRPPSQFLGDTDFTSVYQFPRMTYRFNQSLQTYELDTFDFQKLQ